MYCIYFIPLLILSAPTLTMGFPVGSQQLQGQFSSGKTQAGQQQMPSIDLSQYQQQQMPPQQQFQQGLGQGQQDSQSYTSQKPTPMPMAMPSQTPSGGDQGGQQMGPDQGAGAGADQGTGQPQIMGGMGTPAAQRGQPLGQATIQGQSFQPQIGQSTQTNGDVASLANLSPMQYNKFPRQVLPVQYSSPTYTQLPTQTQAAAIPTIQSQTTQTTAKTMTQPTQYQVNTPIQAPPLYGKQSTMWQQPQPQQ